jgi:hypothetical protein
MTYRASVTACCGPERSRLGSGAAVGGQQGFPLRWLQRIAAGEA